METRLVSSKILDEAIARLWEVGPFWGHLKRILHGTGKTDNSISISVQLFRGVITGGRKHKAILENKRLALPRLRAGKEPRGGA